MTLVCTDDTWLTLSPHQLDDMLNETYQTAFQHNDVTCDLGHVAANMKAFVNTTSSHEGAEFPSHDACADDSRFDPSGFIQNMQEMFGVCFAYIFKISCKNCLNCGQF